MSVRSSHRRGSVKKGVLKSLANSTEKYLCWSLFFNKIAGSFLIKETPTQGFFPVKFAKFLRTPTLKNIRERLLLECDLSRKNILGLYK